MNEGSFEYLLHHIKVGREGKGLWIPLRSPSLRKEIGITKRLYHLIGGDSGTGKTSYTDATYVLDAHTWLKKNETDIKMKTLYLSMERSQVYKKAKWLAYRLYRENGIVRSVNDILSHGTAKHKVTDELLSVIETHGEFFDDLYKEVVVIDGKNNPTGIYKMFYDFALDNGTIYGRDDEGRLYKITKQSWNEKDQANRQIYIEDNQCPITIDSKYKREYVPNDPNLLLQIVIDHIGKVLPEASVTTDKQIIDKTSNYLQIARDFFGMSVVVIQQFNRNNANIQRRVNTDLTPESQDFMGSSVPYFDADIVKGLFSPAHHNLNRYKGFDIPKTKDGQFSRFRAVSIMKNTYGVDNLIAAFRFIGECGVFDQIISKPEEVNYNIFKILNDE